ncbi:TlpA family protein disulfide reductase [Paenibacillus sp. S-38]|uniref:TlpA family protein disulfide reductase n=1 Tax=Paenibacillus sp. S-38 TaxID=3416710 RepID=UPI003CEF5DB7
MVISQNLIVILLSAAAGYGLLRLRLRGSGIGGPLGEAVQTALLLWVLVWKLSILLWEPQSILGDPASLLYFNGGEKGVWLASIVSGLYIIYTAERQRLDRILYSDSLLLSLLGGYTLYALGVMLFEPMELGRRLPMSILSLAATALWLRYRPGGTLQSPIRRAAALLAAYALVSTVTGQLADRSAEAGSVMAEAGVGLKPGQAAPDFELGTLDGSSVKLSSYRGRTVIVNFWATWCPPCRTEMPHLQAYHAAQPEGGPLILAVNATTTEVSVPVVSGWSESWKLTFPVLLDKEGTVTEGYNIHSYPTTYVIDKDGVIRYKHTGPMTVDMLEDAAAKAK